jgi:hypothetical protein
MVEALFQALEDEQALVPTPVEVERTAGVCEGCSGAQ